ncbi:MAG: helix-turn-helix transcriptional regulator [Acutalibacteraceae bacterium]|nr:helix-turn-helix transcriptional regulator [Acutalibacteraceae bacterium]
MLNNQPLAKYLGVHQTTYSSYEIGKLSLTADVLVKLAKYYNTSTDYLLGLTDETKPFPKAKN